jgi:hypothetical protein
VTDQTSQAPTVLDCGDPPTPDAGIGSGYATTLDGRRICYTHANELEAATMREHGEAGAVFTAYISSDGRNVTTWLGAVLARVTEHGSSRTGWNGSEVHTWRATDTDGRQWYGRNAGPGMVVMLRPAKHKR